MKYYFYFFLFWNPYSSLEINPIGNHRPYTRYKNHKILKTIACIFLTVKKTQGWNICDNLQGSSSRNLIDPKNFTHYNDTLNNKDFCEQVLNFPSPLGSFFYYEDFFKITNTSILSQKPLLLNNFNNSCQSSINFTNDTPYNRIINYNNNKIYHFCSCTAFCNIVFNNQYYYWIADITESNNWAIGCNIDPFLLIDYEKINLYESLDNDYKDNKFFLFNVTKKIQENISLPEEISCLSYLNQQKFPLSYDDVYNNLYHNNVQSFFLNCGQDLTVLGLFQWNTLYQKQKIKTLVDVGNGILNTAIALGNTIQNVFSDIGNVLGNFFKFKSLKIFKSNPLNYQPLPRKKDYFADGFSGALQFSCWPLFNTVINFTGQTQYFKGITDYNFTNAVVNVNVTALMLPNYFQLYKENSTQKVYGNFNNGSLNIWDKNYSLFYNGHNINMQLPITTTVIHQDFSIKNRTIFYKKPLAWTWHNDIFESHNNSLTFFKPEINQWIYWDVIQEKIFGENDFIYFYNQLKNKVMVEFFSSILLVDKNVMDGDWILVMKNLYEKINPSNVENRDIVTQEFFSINYNSLDPPLELINLFLASGKSIIITKAQAKIFVDAINDGLIYRDILLTTMINENFFVGNLCRNKEFIVEPWARITQLNYTESLKVAQESRDLLKLLGLEENYGHIQDYFMTNYQLVDLLFQELLLSLNCEQLPFTMVTSNDFYNFFNKKFFLPMMNSHLNGKIIFFQEDELMDNYIINLKITTINNGFNQLNNSSLSTSFEPIILSNIKEDVYQWMDNLFKGSDFQRKHIILLGYNIFNFIEWINNSPFKEFFMEPELLLKKKNNTEIIQWLNKIFIIQDALIHNDYYNITTEYGLLSKNTLKFFNEIRQKGNIFYYWYLWKNVIKQYQKVIPSIPLNNLLMTMNWMDKCWTNQICNQWKNLKYPNKPLEKYIEDLYTIYGNTLEQQPIKMFSFIAKEYEKQRIYLKFYEYNDLVFLEYDDLMLLITLNNSQVYLNISDEFWIKFNDCNNYNGFVNLSFLYNCSTNWTKIETPKNNLTREDFIKEFFIYSLLGKHFLKILPLILSFILCCIKKIHKKIFFTNILKFFNHFYLTSSWIDGIIMGFLLVQWNDSSEYLTYFIVLSTVIFSDIFLNCKYGIGHRQPIDALEIPAIQLTFILFAGLLFYFIGLES